MSQAAPLLCINKKDSKLCTIIDAHQWNENTIKDVMPLSNQDIIHEDVARGHIRSKVDLSDAYKQVCIWAEDIWRTAFATISGTYISNVMQQGDCNAPAMFQQLMTPIFHGIMGRFLHVYLDNIFIFSNTPEEHEQHLQVMFE